MNLKSLILTNFKNYSQQELQFSDKINCFIGDNGAGKTNILDAIYYLSFCKSYFNPIDSQNIRHEEGFFALHGTYLTSSEKPDRVSCIQKRNSKKKFSLNKKEYDRLADHIGLLPLVMISPYDRDLINEGSELRRKYIDGVISQFDSLYLNNLIHYNKALQQRNALLKRFWEEHYFDQSSLEIWDGQLIKYGENIYEKRKDFLRNFIPVFQHYFDFISSGNERVTIMYDSQLLEAPMPELISKAVEKDRLARYSTTGIHKDDLLFVIDGHPVKKFGSQGQQKSFVIAIRLAQFEYIKNIKGYKPILLLDDIFDKLDDKRVQKIIQLVSDNNFGQVFITDTQQKRIENLFEKVKIDHMIYRIEDGNAKEIKNNNLNK
ncbi:MAG: DNA replication/repair protein RecF [Bacteroidales bacterium]|nr:DNA replication/repair protein RecF [Bacteroidales bacterium]MCF8344474.1 DNA replication/repair protein RecF [Bacteroidales bacterium]MCF8350387.1 DNA replication/repair protein RecF [Bacteroidales bacterium]MCF8375302.1 DNA replication/repair protein RecF [Bacteroidales bacterium]MCF8400158.1 DNA replication/repair protein RecF [Bacteroidales bacterium]